MSVEYDKSHSVNFWPLYESTRVCKNSWKNLYMIPSSRPYIACADVSEGLDSLNASDARVYMPAYGVNKIHYGLRSGEWEFYIDHNQWKYSFACYEYLINFLHGKRMAVRVADDSLVYVGRLKINSFDVEDSYSKVVIGYDLEYDAGDASLLNLKVAVNYYDYDGTLILTEIVDVGETPTTPEIPEDPNNPENPGTWEEPDPDNPKPVDENTDYHVSSGTIIIDYGGYVTETHTGRTGNKYKIIPDWIERPAMESTPVDSNMREAFWIMAFPKAYAENKDPTIEGKYGKGTVRIFIEYIEAISYDNALAPQPSNLTIGNVDNYSYDSETQTLYFY